MSVKASCPACAGPVEFKVDSSVVTVCPYCRSVVARGDRQLEDLGKVADLTQTESPLAVGRKGRYRGVPFTLTGRAQLGHAQGGVWDEWYAALGDGRWGWLAEAQGRFYMTFAQDPEAVRQIPAYEQLQVGRGASLGVGGPEWLVAEKGTAEFRSAEGEIPYRLEPGKRYRYADLAAAQGEFATLDYGEEPPVLYVGAEVTLDDLGMPDLKRPERFDVPRAQALHLNCPHCGGALNLQAPDKTERVGCPNCGSLLDCNQGHLTLLKALDAPKFKPLIPLGKAGTLAGVTYTLIGFFRRSVTFEGKKYFWEEYLLYQPLAGFRWLTRSDDHWNFVEPLPPGKVSSAGFRKAAYEGDTYKLFQDAEARVEYVLGECYWKVTVGEKAEAADYVHPPHLLSREKALHEGEGQEAGAGEVAWSLGTYLPREEVEKAFGVANLPAPEHGTVAPNQPFPYKGVYRLWLYFLVAAFALLIVVLALNRQRTVFSQTFTFAPVAAPAAAAPGTPAPATPAEASRVVFADKPLRLDGRQSIHITGYSSVQNSWIEIEGELINEEANVIQPFTLPIEYYSGVEEGESWSEGSQQRVVNLSALPAGDYTLRLEASWENMRQPAGVTVSITQGGVRWFHWFLALLGVSVVPLLTALRHWVFEIQRWKDSDYSPYSTGDSDSDSDD